MNRFKIYTNAALATLLPVAFAAATWGCGVDADGQPQGFTGAETEREGAASQDSKPADKPESTTKPEPKPEAKPEPKPEPGPLCVTETLGGDTSCKSALEWSAIVVDACSSRGLVLTARDVAKPCAEGRFRTAKFTCCPANVPETNPEVSPKPEPQPLPPPTPGSACTSGVMGSETSCKSPEVWSAYVVEKCTSEGFEVAGREVMTPCTKGNFRAIKFECCPKAIR
jgi:hypothetical protein